MHSRRDFVGRIPNQETNTNLPHKLRKLRRMSRDEIRSRLTEKLRQRRERKLWQVGKRSKTSVAGIQAVLDSVVNLIPGAKVIELERLRHESAARFADSVACAQQRAAGVLAGRWELLGHAFDFTRPIDWHGDPRTGYHWPRSFYADLPLYDLPGETDVKYVWELGRQQYVVELAQAWCLTGKDRYADRARELALDWIDANPLCDGIHWTSGLEVAVRSINWLWTLAALAAWSGWREDELEEILASLHEHAGYLEHHLSYYSSPYNHLIGEATALFMIGHALSQQADAHRWQRLGRDVLVEHGPRQFYADGFSVEQATGYHYFSLGFLTMAIAAARTIGEPLEELEPVVHRAFRAGLAFRRPDGRWPAIGDLDSARSIPVRHDDFWRFDSLCAVGAVLFDDGELKFAESGPGEELYWLLGADGVRAWMELPANGCQSHQTLLSDSGYAVATDGNDWLLLDGGPIAEGLHADATPSTAHGHADSLQVLYVAGGEPVLEDCGMPFYGGDPEWVQHFRSPAAHNTVEIEGVSLARPAGALAWSRVAERPRLVADFADDLWKAQAYAKYAPGVSVKRQVLVQPGRGLWITDHIATDRSRDVRWFWQLPSSQRVRPLAGDAGGFVWGEGNTLAVQTPDGQVESRLELPSDGNPIAWIAEGYGQRTGASRIAVSARVSDAITLTTYVGSLPISEAFDEYADLRLANQPQSTSTS